ncbi:hypothetical protein [Amycolatopsis sp. H20-H5]|uniref:hypothetical protein n=1 Tax=Amycolatopsis sp. H20-H5 TaxID=3046309 RepID=UPI002DBAD8FA|nr:hypothetical protein [Amycolatopsis sp. H20-H5]MEC3977756.1 hypothetical protein [Amycolatopsis sp. H20-H5]
MSDDFPVSDDERQTDVPGFDEMAQRCRAAHRGDPVTTEAMLEAMYTALTEGQAEVSAWAGPNVLLVQVRWPDDE